MGNLESKTNSEGLLSGPISSFCLLCEDVLVSSEAKEHVQSVRHIENLRTSDLVAEFTLDKIQKVKKGFYCQFCNVYIKTHTKVQLHVASANHINNKDKAPSQSYVNLQLKDNKIIAFDCIEISEASWNAIIKDTCLVCDVDITEVGEHCKLPEHVINLIQANVVGQHYHLYRKIDESMVQCITCNTIIIEKDLLQHFDSKQHRIGLRIASNGLIVKQDISKYNINKNMELKEYIEMKEDNENGLCLVCHWDVDADDISKHLNDFHHLEMLALHNQWLENKKWIKLDSESNKAAPIPLYEVDNKENTNKVINNKDKAKVDNNNNKENKSKKVLPSLDKLVANAIQNYVSNNNVTKNSFDPNITKKKRIETDNSKTEKLAEIEKGDKTAQKENVSPNAEEGTSNPQTEKNEISTIQEIAQEYGIKYKAIGITACSICSERVRGTIEDIKTHVQSSKHKKNYFKTTKIAQNNYETRRMQDYHSMSVSVNLVMRSYIVVNGNTCVDLLSFQCLSPENGRLKCYLCNKIPDDRKRMVHIQSDLHKRLWGNCMIITSFEKEFVREVRPGLYHCGFCNQIFSVWDQLLDHLMSRKHKMYKITSDNVFKCHFRNQRVMQARFEAFLQHLFG